MHNKIYINGADEPHWLYFLIDHGKIVYIGCSKDLMSRMKCHIDKTHNAVRVIKFENKYEALGYETRWIKLFKPKYNKGSAKSGRKRIDNYQEKKVFVGFYIKKKYIIRVGGISEARRIAAEALEHFDKIQKQLV